MKTILILTLLLIAGVSYSQTATDSLHLKQYLIDRENIVSQQETVKSKNEYIQLQGMLNYIDLWIQREQKYLEQVSKLNKK